MNIASVSQSEITRWTKNSHLSRKAWYNREPRTWCAWFMRPLQKLRHRWIDALIGVSVAATTAGLGYAITIMWVG